MPMGESTAVPSDIQDKTVSEAAVAEITTSNRAANTESPFKMPAKFLSEIKIAAEATKTPNGHQDDWRSLSPASQAKLDYTNPSYDPNYDLYRAVVDETLSGSPLLENGGTQKIADKMVQDLQQAGVDTSDTSVSIKKLGEMYLTRRYNQIDDSQPTRSSSLTEKPRHLLTKWRKGSSKEDQSTPSSGITMESAGGGSAVQTKNPDRVITPQEEWVKTLTHMTSQDIARNPNAPPAPTSADYADLRVRRPNIQAQPPEEPQFIPTDSTPSPFPITSTEGLPTEEISGKYIAATSEPEIPETAAQALASSDFTQAPSSADYADLRMRRPNIQEQPPPKAEPAPSSSLEMAIMQAEGQLTPDNIGASMDILKNYALSHSDQAREIVLKLNEARSTLPKDRNNPAYALYDTVIRKIPEWVGAQKTPEPTQSPAEAQNISTEENPGTGTAATDKLQRQKEAEFVRPTLVGKPLGEASLQTPEPVPPPVEYTPVRRQPSYVAQETATPQEKPKVEQPENDQVQEILKGPRSLVAAKQLSTAAAAYQFAIRQTPIAGDAIAQDLEALYLANRDNNAIRLAFADALSRNNQPLKSREVLDGKYNPQTQVEQEKAA